MEVITEYIHHSCYTLDIGEYFLIFDYFKGELKIPENKKVYFFVSHVHSDHYSPIIFDYESSVEKYIISSDVKKIENKKIIYISENETISVDDLIISTFKSTDSGVAFMINAYNKNIFFSGDLNDWYWEMEDSLEQKEKMHEDFKKELDKIKNYNIDIAYMVVDPRQEKNFDLGAKQILNLQPKNFLPLHFWENYEITTIFKNKYSKKYKTDIYDIETENKKIFLDI